MSIFAAAVGRTKNGWTASELDLTGLADIDEVVDALRDAEPDADLAVLFVESDDEYLSILRLDEGDDLRIFGSDSAFAEESRIGSVLLGEVEAPALGVDDLSANDGDDDEERPAADPDADPIGDAELLGDLGVNAQRLLELCGKDGMLPSDVTAEICQRIGCGDEMEELRDA
ncbi:putative tRNA adenosine deaminase-associated protein [Actinoplanes lutulentus]|uniref:Putative tRNA adenosine deaminase-associated protein n=1 Tax=Actinoplanes lutulentus TaxID=1287878 RepID=A0A327Z852_9ACTN|nr:tRNA adenosine deaminase-associated protein [Actinoplanes lutulentus]MBB2945634.1 putative tRNA adenosine deaminase-associated protein [Actinoplanes lutulentus]RAK27232.1 putative tRNA adenosine deaminase-associated protein [Actinoplanes lutulentus]